MPFQMHKIGWAPISWGANILSRLMTGAQVILLKTRIPRDVPFVGGGFIPGGVAIWGVLGSLVFGSFLGVNAGYRGGWWDQIIMQFLDAMIAFPSIIFVLSCDFCTWARRFNCYSCHAPSPARQALPA
jgi:ABC-type antimicrobial peptide transport system permease subunit